LTEFQVVELTSYCNNDGISSDADRSDGDFTGTGQTYPEEDLPPSNSLFKCGEVPFIFPDKSDGKFNNISLEGQGLPIETERNQRLRILGAADLSLEDRIVLNTNQGIQHELPLRLSSWRLGRDLKYGEVPAILCSGFHFPSQHVYTERLDLAYGIWMQTIPLPDEQANALVLPDNPGMHIFALTLES
jgi:alpha-L-fucosidase 2